MTAIYDYGEVFQQLTERGVNIALTNEEKSEISVLRRTTMYQDSGWSDGSPEFNVNFVKQIREEKRYTINQSIITYVDAKKAQTQYLVSQNVWEL